MQNNTISGRDIVVVGQQAWDVEIGSNCKNIAEEFSRQNRVLYVNSPLDRITVLRRKDDPKIRKRIEVIRGKEKALVQVSENIWNLYPDKLVESINWIDNHSIFRYLNKRNNRIFARSILAAIDELGFKDIILFNDNDIFKSFYLKDFLNPSLSIYYSRDFMLGVDYWKKHGELLEPELIGKSDICVANSTYLSDYCRRYNPSSFYVGQGCDLSIFNSENGLIPEDLRQIAGPLIGYVGSLSSSRLDISILSHIAETRPDWSLVLVGIEDEVFRASSLHYLENIHFLGHKNPDTLPQYISGFDICLNPQLVNEITIGNYPRKIDEYLAMGKPVVATHTRAMEIFKGYTYLAHTKEDYVTLIDRALAENSDDLSRQRKEFAASHTWENNVSEIYRAINSILKEA